MGIEAITARILREAEEEADRIKNDADGAKEKALQAAGEEARSLVKEAEEKARKDAVLLKERRRSVAELEGRKMRLAMKQELIGEVFDEVLERIAGMDAKASLDYLVRELEPFAREGGEVFLSKKDLDRCGDELKKRTAGTALTVSDEPADIRGGFILKRGSVYVNASAEQLLEAGKQEMTAACAAILFK